MNDSGIDLLRALGQVETAIREGALLEEAIQHASQALGVDRERLLDLFLAKLDGCAEARDALGQMDALE